MRSPSRPSSSLSSSCFSSRLEGVGESEDGGSVSGSCSIGGQCYHNLLLFYHVIQEVEDLQPVLLVSLL